MTLSTDLYVRKRELHGVTLWWICRKIEEEGKRPHYVPYADIHAPTGYGFRSKAKAEQRARELEQERA